MIELLVIVCLMTDPQRCKEVSLVYSGETVTPMQCLMGAQAEIAKWVEAHPKWTVRRWACGRPGRYAKV